MTGLRTTFTASLFVFVPLHAQPPAANSAPTVPRLNATSGWVFELLPKAFQKNPRIDVTVITEMTELGRKQPPASSRTPVYFVAHSSGYHAMGQAPAHERTLKAEDVERLLTRALAANGYLPARTPEHPPTLAVFYTWGSHNLLTEGDPDNPSLSPEQVARNLLDRAALVGGENFAANMLRLFEQESSLRATTSSAARLPAGAIGPVVGPDQIALMSPMHLFRMDAKNDFLVEQFSSDVYYVVASAYDYASLTKNQRQLLWRTRMTVAAQGVSQEQTLPALIASAAPFFGKDMSGTEILSRRAVPEG